jgi:hypothetical protein
MLTRFSPYIEGQPPPIPAKFDAYIPVRVAAGPQSDGYLNVYLPDGTAFVVKASHLLRLDPDQNGSGVSPKGQAEREANAAGTETRPRPG